MQASATESFLEHLVTSFRVAIGKALLAPGSVQLSKALFEAPFALLAHDASSDPIYNFGNQRALLLWEMNFDEFTRMPSRLCAEPVHQATRQAFLSEVERCGFVAGYTGIRISKTGRRFRIVDAVCWNVFDAQGVRLGQAACFDRVIELE